MFQTDIRSSNLYFATYEASSPLTTTPKTVNVPAGKYLCTAFLTGQTQGGRGYIGVALQKNGAEYKSTFQTSDQANDWLSVNLITTIELDTDGTLGARGVVSSATISTDAKRSGASFVKIG